MDKKEWLTPVLIFLLSVCFIVVCVGVFLSRGKLAKWINLKMKIGGLLLSLTAVSCNNYTEPTCYDPISPPFFENSMAIESSKVINLEKEAIISGKVLNKNTDKFSFALYNRYFQKVQSGNLAFLPYDDDDPTIYFNISINSNLKSGKYFISLYDADTSKQNLSYRKYNNSIYVLNDTKACFKLKIGQPLSVKFTNCKNATYSFNIVDDKGEVLQTGDLDAKKSFYNRRIFVKLDDNILTGIYRINIYKSNTYKQNSKNRIVSYKIKLF